MTATDSKKIPFFVGNAFTSDPFGGNPAAVVFLQEELPDETLQNIAANFNQPMTVFVYPPLTPNQPNTQAASFRVRWFTSAVEIRICGHGSLVAAGTIFSVPGVAPDGVQELHFQGTTHALTARRVGDETEITLAAAAAERVFAEEEERITGIVTRAMGDTLVRSVWVGSEGVWRSYLLVEIEETQGGDLASRKVDCNIFVSMHCCSTQG